MLSVYVCAVDQDKKETPLKSAQEIEAQLAGRVTFTDATLAKDSSQEPVAHSLGMTKALDRSFGDQDTSGLPTSTQLVASLA